MTDEDLFFKSLEESKSKFIEIQNKIETLPRGNELLNKNNLTQEDSYNLFELYLQTKNKTF